MNGLTVSVGYDDFLALTLPRNAVNFARIVVVTTPGDRKTIQVAEEVENVTVLTTDVFSKGKATFNKGAAIEEGLEVLGREGWICVFDADIEMPGNWEESSWQWLETGFLYGARRRVQENPYQEELDFWTGHPARWLALPLAPDSAKYGPWPATHVTGSFHLYHAEDPVLGQPPWYSAKWRHAAGFDSEFIAKWPRKRHRHTPFEVLHYGPIAENWWGRRTLRLDGTVPETAERSSQMLAQMRCERERRPNLSWEKM
jgi:hypothetical protein